MGIETGDLFSGLNEAWPAGTELRSEGDDHLRQLKHVLKYTFSDTSTTFVITKGSATYTFASTGDITANGLTYNATNGQAAVVWKAGSYGAGGFKVTDNATGNSVVFQPAGVNLYVTDGAGQPVGITASNFTSPLNGSVKLTMGSSNVTASHPIVLPADPTNLLEAATKQYADTKVAEAPNDTRSYARQALGWTNNPTFNGLVTNSSPSSFSLYYADSPAGFNRGLQMRTGTSARWIFYTDNTAESGGNAGSDFGIVRYSDAGANIGTPLTINRASGLVTMATGLSLTGGALVLPTGTAAATTLNFGTAGSGLYFASSAVNVSISGASKLAVGPTLTTISTMVRTIDGTVAAPSYSFTNSSGMGLWRVGADQIGFATAGVNRLTLSTTAVTSTLPVVLPADPANALEAATKQMVDAKEPALPAGGTTSNFLRGDKTWAVPAGGGSGDVVGPASTVDNTVPRFDTTTGKLLQSSTFTIDDNGFFAFKNAGQTMVAWETTYNSTGSLTLRAAPPHGQTFTISCRNDTIGSPTFVGGGSYTFDSPIVIGASSVTTTVNLSCQASGGTRRSLKLDGGIVNLPHNTTPSAPVNGDIWTETTGVFARINGATKQVNTNISVGTTAPSSPAVNDVWIDTN